MLRRKSKGIKEPPKEFRCQCGKTHKMELANESQAHLPSGWEIRHFGWYISTPVYITQCDECEQKLKEEKK